MPGRLAKEEPPLARSPPTRRRLGLAEPDSPVPGMEVDLESPLMDDDVVVEPAEHDQLVLIGLTTRSPRRQVVDLKSTSRITPVGGAAEAVSGHQLPPECRGRGALPAPVVHESPVFGPRHDLGIGVAEDPLEGLPTDSGPASRTTPDSPSVGTASLASTMTVT